MNTHTIRWNGTKAHKIVTFTPQYLKILKKSHRDAVSLVIMKLLKDLKELTGIPHTIDHMLMLQLNNHFRNLYDNMKKIQKNSITSHHIKRWFEQGYLNSPLGDCEEDIESLNHFYMTFY